MCVVVDLWEPHQQSLLQWDVSTFCVHVSIESDCWKETCHSNAAARPVIYSALTEMAQSVSLHSLSQTRMGPMPSAGSEGMLSSSIGSQVPSKLGPFVAKLGCVWSERRQELFSFQCENRQISRSESTFSFQSHHMHAPQRGVNGLCVEMRGVFRGCKQRDEELGCTLWFFLSVVHKGF